MKRYILILTVLLISASTAFSGNGRLGAYLSHATFNIPGEGPYLETYLEIIGNTIEYRQNGDGMFQGSVQVTMIVRKDTSIVDFRKFELKSPLMEDTTSITLNFIDQQRFMLENGHYELDLSIADLNRNGTPVVVSYPFSIDFPDNSISISGVQLIGSFTKTTTENVLSKSGYDFVPFADNFYPAGKDKITFYAEVYNPLHTENSGEKFLVSAFIETFESNRMLNEYVRIKRESSRPVTVLLSEFDISNLPSGNYNLVILVRNKNNEIVGQNTVFFQRFNPAATARAMNFADLDLKNSFSQQYTNADTLREYIRSLSPIATEMEKIFINTQLNGAELRILQNFFHAFWSSRNEFDPSAAWHTYRLEVIKVNQAYSTQVKKGYETDMGRVYLQYGPPNTIIDKSFETQGYNLSQPTQNLEYGSVPYQIWHYYSINNNRERNKRFVFISSGLRVTDYQLVHSDVRGELQNYNWQRLLIRGADIHDSGNIIDYDSDAMRKDKRRSSMYYNDLF